MESGGTCGFGLYVVAPFCAGSGPEATASGVRTCEMAAREFRRLTTLRRAATPNVLRGEQYSWARALANCRGRSLNFTGVMACSGSDSDQSILDTTSSDKNAQSGYSSEDAGADFALEPFENFLAKNGDVLDCFDELAVEASTNEDVSSEEDESEFKSEERVEQTAVVTETSEETTASEESDNIIAPVAKQALSEEQAEMTKKELEKEMQFFVEPRWYFVQTKSACENTVRTSLENMAVNDPLAGVRLKDVIVPSKAVVKYNKAGRPTQKNELLFPGYVLVYIGLDKHCYNEIGRVPNVQGFAGDPNREQAFQDGTFRPPPPLSDREVSAIFGKIQAASGTPPEVILAFRRGDMVEIKDGPFKGTEGRVQSVDNSARIVLVNLIVFGRESPAEFAFRSLRKIQYDS